MKGGRLPRRCHEWRRCRDSSGRKPPAPRAESATLADRRLPASINDFRAKRSSPIQNDLRVGQVADKPAARTSANFAAEVSVMPCCLGGGVSLLPSHVQRWNSVD
jgi:hypothetical protein